MYGPHGVIPATLLAFDEDYAINEASSRKHLRDCALISGVTAATVNGPWQDANAASPLTISADQTQQYGRAVR